VAKLHLSAGTVKAWAAETFTTKGSKAPAGVRLTQIAFGDGTRPVQNNYIRKSYTHRYHRTGDYTVALRITDRLGRVARTTRTVHVTAANYATGATKPTSDVQPDTTLPTADQLPASIDLRNYAMPVQNQGQLGSCTTWAINYGMLGWYARRTGMAVQTFAPMYSYAQLVNGNPNQGTAPADVMKIAEQQGVAPAADYSSTNWAYDYKHLPTATQQADAQKYKIAGWRYLFANQNGGGATADEIYGLKSQLASGYPAAIAFNVYDSLYRYTGGVYRDTSSTFSGRHSVLALGYDSSGLLIENSWGSSWGDHGYLHMSWAAVGKDVYMAEVIDGFVPRQSAGDTTAPTATAPVQRMAAGDQMNSYGVPVTVSWTGADNSGSIAGFDLFASTDGGEWTQQTLAQANATRVTYALAPGSTYRFAVRSRDAAGNASEWQYGPSFSVGNYQEDSGYVGYSGTWNYASFGSADHGQLAVSATPNSAASFTFTGRNVAWIATMAANRGQAYVYVDGAYKFTQDLYSSTTKARSLAVVGNWSTSAQHTITVVVVGTSGRPTVDVDSFILLS
jgi:hypothetical protein